MNLRLAGTTASQAQTVNVVGVQNHGVGRTFDDDPLDLGQFFDGVDPAQTQMIRRDVQTSRHVRALIPKTRPHQAVGITTISASD